MVRSSSNLSNYYSADFLQHVNDVTLSLVINSLQISVFAAIGRLLVEM
jgi:hypothetical protein